MPAGSFSPRGRPDRPEDLMRGNGDWSTDVLPFSDALKATISELGPKDPRSPLTQKAQDVNTDTSTPISRHRTDINLIGSKLPRRSGGPDTNLPTPSILQNQSISVKLGNSDQMVPDAFSTATSESSSINHRASKHDKGKGKALDFIPSKSSRLQGGQSVSGPKLPVKKEYHDASFSKSNTVLPTAALGRQSSMLIMRTSRIVYGIVLYDFAAERSDELEAKAGEAIIVVAQSNPEWFVAQPISRPGSPGLIPASFVEIRDMATNTAVANAQDAVKRAGIPRVEEWKTMAANYEKSSITADKFEGRVADPRALFKECVPTNGRLMKLRDAWINTASLHLRLLYCQPFNLVFRQRGKLVMERHHDLADLLQRGELESFFEQVVQSWPQSFGELKSTSDEPCFFRWHAVESYLDDGTVFLCRVAGRNEGQQWPLEALISSGTSPVDLYPADNILWYVYVSITSKSCNH